MREVIAMNSIISNIGQELDGDWASMIRTSAQNGSGASNIQNTFFPSSMLVLGVFLMMTALPMLMPCQSEPGFDGHENFDPHLLFEAFRDAKVLQMGLSIDSRGGQCWWRSVNDPQYRPVQSNQCYILEPST
jgi:hypothetical protein